MKKIIAMSFLFVFVGMFYSCNKTVERPPEIPVEDFFRNPEKSSFRLSPDGLHIAYMAPFEDMMNVFYSGIEEDTATRVTNETERSIYFFAWANNTTILYFKDVGGDENFQIFATNIESGEVKPVYAREGVRAQPVDMLEDIPNEIIISTNERVPMVFDPYRVNLETGEMTILAENPGDITSWITDHDGKLRMAIATDGVNQRILYRDDENGDFQELMQLSFKETFNPVFFTFDNQKFYAASNLGRDKTAIVLYNPKTNEEEEIIFQTDEVDVSGISYSDKRKVLTHATYVTDKVHRHFFDEQTEQMYEDLKTKLPAYEVSVSSSNKEEDLFLVVASSDRNRGIYHFYDPETKVLTYLHEITPWLNEEHLAKMEPIQYESRDGLTIHGYLTVPAGIEARDLPVVINPHGGPWARDYWGFNPEVQMLANRGYAVLQMNFRGSTGYGKEFWQISFKEWGRSMQDDISDGVMWLIDQGIADPDRVAIYGGSYGGYATLVGLTQTPELYCCGVDYVGVSNMFTFMQTIPAYWEPMRAMFYEMVGDPEKDSLMLAEVSPVMNVDKIEDPLFIAQGARDPRVNKAESDQMVEALETRGIDVEYMVKENEGHGFYNEENRFDFYNAMIGFLDTHMKSEGEETMEEDMAETETQ